MIIFRNFRKYGNKIQFSKNNYSLLFGGSMVDKFIFMLVKYESNLIPCDDFGNPC